MFQQISSNKPCKKEILLISSLKRAKLKTGFWLGFNLSFLRVWNDNDVLRFFKFRFITYTIYTHARSFYSRSNVTSIWYFWGSAYRIALTPISTLQYDTHISRETTFVLAISPYIYQCDLNLTPGKFIILITCFLDIKRCKWYRWWMQLEANKSISKTIITAL